ncbi:hypothetical protein [Streptomyces pseudovenezuelae]|uniref:hypothetical protein n=1 Tax=Streptomyces pseudovenezuelae TaxID=67350 RepID=UPI002E304770|nr:hypothetical protein [Streptomyces pseudovenezuelae]
MGIAVVSAVGVVLICIIVGTTIALYALANKSKGGDALTEQIRSIAGMFVVVTVVAALLTVAAWGVWRSGGGTDKTVTVLTSAFTAATSITTAYFGIRAVSNTARHAINKRDPSDDEDGDEDGEDGHAQERAPTSEPRNEPPRGIRRRRSRKHSEIQRNV